MSQGSLSKYRNFAASPQGQSLQERLSDVRVSLLPFAAAARDDDEQLSTRVKPKAMRGALSDLEEIARLLGTGDTENAARLALCKHNSILHEVLLPAFAWLDRWTLRSSSTDDNTSLLTNLHVGLQRVIEHLLLRCASLDGTQPLLHQYVCFALAFARSDALSCLARRLRVLRGHVLTISKHPVSAEQISLLRTCTTFVESDVKLARAAWNIDDEHVPSLRQARDAAFAASNAVQHMCATVMTLAEWLPGMEAGSAVLLAGTRITSLDGAPIMQLESQGVCRMVDLRSRFAKTANDLAAFLAHFARDVASARPGVEVAHGRMLFTPRAEPHPQLLPVLLHPAVQYFLGWAAVGLPTAAGLRGSFWDGAFGDVRVPWLRGCRGPDGAIHGYQAKLEALREVSQVQEAAAGAWSAALTSGAAQLPRRRTANAVQPPPSSPAAHAAPASADGASSSTSATAADGPGPTASAAAPAAATASPLPYRTAQMYRMLLDLFEEVWRLLDAAPARGEPKLGMLALEANSGLEGGLLALAECLTRLPPAAAARRLPAAWLTVVKQLTYASNPFRHLVNKAVYLVVGQLLVTTAHLRAPPVRPPGEQQGQEGGGAGGSGADAGAGCAAAAGGGGSLSSSGGSSGSGGGSGCSSSGQAVAGPSSMPQAVPPPGTRPSTAPPTSTSTAAPSQHALGPSYTLSCALAAGLLPSLECELRHMLTSARHASGLPPSARAIDMALRRHGCWPAMLAHGDPRQVASLVLTLGKAARVAASQTDAPIPGGVVAGAGWPGSPPSGDVRGLVRQQLMALLEQLGPQVMGPGGKKEQRDQQGQEGGGQGEQQRQGAAARQGTVPLQQRLRGMELNRALRGEVMGEEGAAGGGSSSSCSTKHAFWAGSGPGWEQVVSHGGCPAPGSPQLQQLQRMAALAAVHWLPSLLLYPYTSGTPGAAEAPGGERLLPVPLTITVPNGEHRVAWAWLRLVARQALPCTFWLLPPPGSGSPRDPLTWRRLLVRDLRGVLQVAVVLKAAVSLEGRSGGGGSGGGGEGGEGGWEQQQQALLAAVGEVLPAALDVLEVLLVTDMEEVAKYLGINVLARRERAEEAAAAAGSVRGGRGARRRAVQGHVVTAGWGPGLAWDEAVRGLMLQQGRVRLVACLDMLACLDIVARHVRLGSRVSGGVTREEAEVLQEMWREARERLSGELPQLPGPCVDVGFARCANPVCCGVAGASEATVQLLLCGRCRAVGYCSAACQKWDWAAGHKAECGAGAGAGRG